MATKQFMVKEGYVFLYLNNVGGIVKKVHAGSVVEIPDINYQNQAYKLEPVTEAVPPLPNDLKLIQGVNEKCLEFFEERDIATFRDVAALEPEELVENVKGVGMPTAEKILRSAFELAGMG